MKRFHRANQNKYIEEEVQESKKEHGLQFSKFDFVAGVGGGTPI